MADDFMRAFNQNQVNPDLPAFTRPFIGTPDKLSPVDLQELIYKYQYLDYTIPPLASEYRLTPRALELYIEENSIEPQILETETDFEEHDERVAKLYRQLRIKLSGLVILQSAKIWESLASSEENLVDALHEATETVLVKKGQEVKELSALISAYGKIVDRQELIKRAIEAPAEKDITAMAEQLSDQFKDLFQEIQTDHRLPSEQEDEANADED